MKFLYKIIHNNSYGKKGFCFDKCCIDNEIVCQIITNQIYLCHLVQNESRCLGENNYGGDALNQYLEENNTNLEPKNQATTLGNSGHCLVTSKVSLGI